DLWPEKFGNVTNGVTPRRFVAVDNPRLTDLISSRIGNGWLASLDRLRELEPRAGDPEFRDLWRRVKLENKRVLALEIRRRCGIEVDPESLFDVHVKRIHEYKRQHLNVLRVIAHYLDLRENSGSGRTPRTVIFAGKAAPGYFLAKLVIKLIHSVAEVLNGDGKTGPLLKVLFLPDYNVKTSRRIFPAADLSEQISTAGKEASGTGNMKFALNGALTIGTYDGANIEIREEVGADNFFLFGLRAEEVAKRKAWGYRPRDHYESDPRLRAAIDLVASGFFSDGDRSLFRPLLDSILDRDDYMVCADFSSYLACQEDVDRTYRDRDRWTRMSILNVSRMGKFSSDRAVAEYCRDIWHVDPVPEARKNSETANRTGEAPEKRNGAKAR
ncbi:MAG TPA: glycogen/starch/alpha-glucan phosphorylase, partial [Candidatus Deferrimicrobiaceae bacterium]|nr:glycogen/starch/alpha-glucan phosphorylase [Candidatus Deferrimicrobiaceae bacterium]